MTVEELYKMTKQIIYEKPSSTIYDNYVVGNINKIIIELFEENNMARMFKGKTPLSVKPIIDMNMSYSDAKDIEIPYEDEYCYNVMPIGLAKYFMIDDDLNKYSIYDVEYNNARVQHQKIVSSEVIDALTQQS